MASRKREGEVFIRQEPAAITYPSSWVKIQAKQGATIFSTFSKVHTYFREHPEEWRKFFGGQVIAMDPYLVERMDNIQKVN